MPHTLATSQPADSNSTGDNLLDLPGIDRYDIGNPFLGLDPQSLPALGGLLWLRERLVLDHFSRGVVPGATHTFIGEELTAMLVVRAMNHTGGAVVSNPP